MTTPAKPAVEVEVETTEREGGQVELSVRVAPEPVAAAKERIVQAASRRANVPGFRKGKAPRALLERHLDQDFIKQQVIESLVGEAYDAAVEKAELKTLGSPDVENAELAEDGALVFRVTVTRRPEITLGEYEGLKATRYVTPVTDAQVEAELERVRGRQARYAELPEGAVIEKGDLAVVDYEMEVDGEKREGGGATGYPLEVGADELFPQLNEALLGARPEEAREFEVTYPETHTDEELAGKTAVFKVTVQQARRRQLPELDDEFAKQVSDLSTMAELRERVRQNLETVARSFAEEDVENQLIRQVSEAASLDVPEALVEREAERRVNEISAALEQRRDSLHGHLRRHNLSYEDWRADIVTQSRQEVRKALVLDEIGLREEIKVTDEEAHEELHRLAEREKLSEEQLHQQLHESGEFNRMINRLYHRKIIQLLVERAEISEQVGEPKPAEEAGAEG